MAYASWESGNKGKKVWKGRANGSVLPWVFVVVSDGSKQECPASFTITLPRPCLAFKVIVMSL